MSGIFNAAIYQPLYNGLILLFNIFPWADAGVLVIVFTVIVKLILFPLSYKSVKTQIELRKYDPELKKIRESYPDKQIQAAKVMEFYKEKNINPFANFFLLIIQLPIIFALYFIFLKSGLPSINNDLLYPFVHAPGGIDMQFLGLIDIANKSLVLALLAGISSFIQMKLSVPPPVPKSDKSTFQDDLARTMGTQMRFILPLMAFFISYRISGVVALYWFTSNIFAIAQELYVRKKLTPAVVK